MIPGIVAGFPKPAVYAITITGANAGNSAGFLRSSGQGSIDPAYANIDQVTTTQDAMGQINQFRAVQNEGTGAWTTTMTLVGTYANAAAVPFTTLTRDGISYPKSGATFSTGGGFTTFTWANKQVSNGAYPLIITP